MESVLSFREVTKSPYPSQAVFSDSTTKGADPTGWRIKADTLELALSAMLKTYLIKACQNLQLKADMKVHEVAGYICQFEALSLKAALSLIQRVDLTKGILRISINADGLAALLSCPSNTFEPDHLIFEEPISFQRRQNGTKLIWAQYKQGPRTHLIKALHEAHDWLNQIKSGKQIAGLKQQTGLLDRTIWKRMRLACLSPKVQKAILAGTLHHDITIRTLESKAVPQNWAEQEALYITKVPC